MLWFSYTSISVWYPVTLVYRYLDISGGTITVVFRYLDIWMEAQLLWYSGILISARLPRYWNSNILIADVSNNLSLSAMNYFVTNF